MVVSWVAVQRKLKESVLGKKWECPVSHIGLENQVPQWHQPTLAQITPLNLSLISTGLVVIAPPCLLYACPKVILASSFISLCSFEYICFGLPFPHTRQLGFFSLDCFSFPRTHLVLPPLPHRQPNASLSSHSLLSHLMLYFPALWTGHCAVTDGDTLLWLPLVNVSITSSLRQRGENP